MSSRTFSSPSENKKVKNNYKESEDANYSKTSI